MPQPQTSRTAANRVRQILRMVFPLFNATVDGFANEGLHFGKCAGLFGGGRRFPDDGVEFGRKFFDVFGLVFNPFDIVDVKHVHVQSPKQAVKFIGLIEKPVGLFGVVERLLFGADFHKAHGRGQQMFGYAPDFCLRKKELFFA